MGGFSPSVSLGNSSISTSPFLIQKDVDHISLWSPMQWMLLWFKLEILILTMIFLYLLCVCVCVCVCFPLNSAPWGEEGVKVVLWLRAQLSLTLSFQVCPAALDSRSFQARCGREGLQLLPGMTLVLSVIFRVMMLLRFCCHWLSLPPRMSAPKACLTGLTKPEPVFV
jgi:hypothetical protein